MTEEEQNQIQVKRFVRAEKIMKRISSKYFLANISYRSRSRKSFSKRQLKQWLGSDFYANINVISDLISAGAITEISYEIYAVTKNFRDFFPTLNSGGSVIEIIRNQDF